MRLSRRVLLTIAVLAAGCSSLPRLHLSRGGVPEGRLSQSAATGTVSSEGFSDRPRSITERERAALQSVATDAATSIVAIRAALRIPSSAESPEVATRATSTRLGGTGVVIGRDGLILTNEHVVRDAKTVTVILSDGSVYEAEQTVVAPHLDLAVLRIGKGQLEPLKAAANPVTPGAAVVALLAPAPHRPGGAQVGVVTDAAVSLQDELDASRRRHYNRLIENTARLDPGFSGGPLLDADGQLVGINVAASGGDDEVGVRGYAIPVDREVQAVVDRLIHEIGSGRPSP